MFMLNMLFDLNDTNGIFADPDSTDPLQRSYAWLKYDADSPSAAARRSRWSSA